MQTLPDVAAAIEATSQRFADADLHYGHGTDSPWDEATYLVLNIAALPDDASVLAEQLTPQQWQDIQVITARRIGERVPLAYLLGRCQYVGLEFQIAPGVLVPRSPLGPWLLNHGDQWLPRAPRRILDLCCGSGCLGIVAALRYPDAQLVLTDIDSNALQLAAANVAAHGLQARTHLLQANGAESLAANADFDLVLCNPPYVNAADMAALPLEYQREPALALAAGEDGLAVMSPILARLPALLRSSGLFLGEVGLSETALRQAHPELPLLWLDMRQGGEGTFAILAEQLAE